MTEQRKEIMEIIGRMSTKFEEIKDNDTKAMSVMVITAYQSGREVGILEAKQQMAAAE